jgi:hypothetical protein
VIDQIADITNDETAYPGDADRHEGHKQSKDEAQRDNRRPRIPDNAQHRRHIFQGLKTFPPCAEEYWILISCHSEPDESVEPIPANVKPSKETPALASCLAARFTLL